MSGEKNLDVLLANMIPELQSQAYVFASMSYCGLKTDETTRKTLVGALLDDTNLSVIALFQEKEGMTVYCTEEFLTSQVPKELILESSQPMGMITLQIHSALDAVGLTAAFATELGQHGISANVMAGFYHDHIFVSGGLEMGRKAVQVLQSLSARKKEEQSSA
ncbi:Pfam:DUF2241 [Seminavis robusta]|uniref:Pfam:DUF2241 n=1 Tax=Seminavis robusta TaxID=568900 RepID=A0A9N8F3L3_9STRA|nr:Pfam:DUF2241 [Seminavis robusta]|eukprot:Sro3017_g342150.1 Pfam:DUF2241 (163) ;mRNA; r:6860-7348